MRVVATVRRRATPLSLTVLALLAYVPALASSPGRMPADTKLYLYLDPGRLLGDAPFSYDPRQFAGWVPHQIIGYLWPQGPWYWLGETAGLADWVTHRLWIATLMFLAGAGVMWAARRLGLGPLAALVAAIVYQLAPYLLPYVSRTSAMLLPWAGLGWIVGLVVGAATRTRWRDAALAALVVATVGAPNATALVMITPAPVLWLIVAAAQRQIPWRRAGMVTVRVGVLSLGVSLWWMAMVAVQGRHGADVLSYSESLEAVSFTSTSTEVWRDLGYWLTYVRDAYAPTTTAGIDYMISARVIGTGFLLLLIGLAGLVLTRWPSRRYAITLVVTGVVLGVGVHLITDPSPLMDVLLGDGESGPALALRSSTRAVPVLVFGLGLGAGALVDALPASVAVARWGTVPIRALAAGAVALLAVLYLPVLTGARFVDPAIDRDESPPVAWTDATAALDAEPAGGRVLQLPGAEFGAFRWGYTVDPPLPGMTERPLVTRDLLPLGSPAVMDLLYALDDRFQSGVAELDAVAAVARLLGADTLWLTGDAAFDRFRTPRPELVHAAFGAGAAGLGPPRAYGDAATNQPNVAMVDEQSVSDTRIGRPVPSVELIPVEEAVAVVRAKDAVVVLAGSGDGIVDAAAAGLIDGHELVRYSAALPPGELAEALGAAELVILTDSNRDRAHHWRGSQDVVGFTETGGPESDALRLDDGDERLPVFPDSSPAVQTIAIQEGPVQAFASAYGEPFAYRPESRPFMAIDGDPATAWVVADRAPAEGEFIRLQIDEPIDHVTLRQPAGAQAVRHVGQVTIAVEGTEPLQVVLDDRSLTAPGQRVELGPTAGPVTLTVTIESVVVPDPTIGPALAAVGFAEIDVGLGPTSEVVRLPLDTTRTMAADPAETPLAVVLTRHRTRPTDRWRSDPEPAMVRELELAGARDLTPAITVRLDQRASDAVLADLLGVGGASASARLTGVAAASGWAATDGDRSTAWITPFGGAVGARLAVENGAEISSLTLSQRPGDFSPITGLRLTAAGRSVDVAVPPAGANGESTITLPAPLPAGPVEAEITAIETRTTIDRRYGEPVVLPAAIAEISIGNLTALPDRVDTGCRDDLITIDGAPLAVRVEASTAALIAGEAVTARPCADEVVRLGPGTHRVTTASGAPTGLQVDRIVLADARVADLPSGPATGGPVARVTSSGRTTRTVTVDGCPDGCWLVFGEGFHDAWSASTDAGDLGEPHLVDGGFNGWWIPPSNGPTVVDLRWTAQRSVTIALGLSALAVVAAIVLALLDRRREPAAELPPARFEFPGPREPLRSIVAAGATWVVAAGLLVGPGWALLGALGAIGLGLLGRPRLAGLVAIGIIVFIAVVVIFVVRDERPFPNAGWPARFQWLHGLGLFGAVSLLPAAIGWRPRSSGAKPS
jgi:arabinofuranan 3-O-arabinosyltransferase